MKAVYTDTSTIKLLSLINAEDISTFSYWLDFQIMRGSFSVFFRITTQLHSSAEKMLVIGILPTSEHTIYLSAMSNQEKLYLNATPGISRAKTTPGMIERSSSR